MKVTLSLDGKLLEDAQRIAVERGTTLAELVRRYLEDLVSRHAAAERKRRDLEALERSFSQFQFRVGKRAWRREDLLGKRSTPTSRGTET
jgi:hypothetical protein